MYSSNGVVTIDHLSASGGCLPDKQARADREMCPMIGILRSDTVIMDCRRSPTHYRSSQPVVVCKNKVLIGVLVKIVLLIWRFKFPYQNRIGVCHAWCLPTVKQFPFGNGCWAWSWVFPMNTAASMMPRRQLSARKEIRTGGFFCNRSLYGNYRVRYLEVNLEGFVKSPLAKTVE